MNKDFFLDLDRNNSKISYDHYPNADETNYKEPINNKEYEYQLMNLYEINLEKEFTKFDSPDLLSKKRRHNQLEIGDSK